MLEEALQDEKHNPNESAVALLDFLAALPMGGAAAEARFCKTLFLPLCDRVFGPLVVASDGVYRHKDSAWLATSQRWRLPSAAGDESQSPRHRIASPTNKAKTKTWKDDPVIKLLDASLATIPTSTSSLRQPEDGLKENGPLTLLAAITGESENRPSIVYAFPFFALPKQAQDAWSAAADLEQILAQPQTQQQIDRYRVYISDNQKKLYLQLLRFKPSEQYELIAHRHKQAPSASPFQMPPPPSYASPLRQPFASPPPTRNLQTPSQTDKDQITSSPMIRLGMLEYYLVSFIHFALAPPTALTTALATPAPARTSPLKALRRPAHFGQTVYTHLFRQYCRHFMSTARQLERPDTRKVARQEAEVFLRLVVALWLESQSRLQTTASVVTNRQERYQRRAGRLGNDSQSNQSEPVLDLDASYDLVVADGSFTFLSALVKDCLRFLVQHMMADPKILTSVQQYSASHATAPAAASPSKGDGGDVAHDWCLIEAMTTLQLPLYNYIRAAFRYAPIHSPNSSLFTAMDLWLNWLEPWNSISLPSNHGAGTSQSHSQQQQLRNRITISRSGNRKAYDQRQWEPYVAANLCLYTVPLAIFLRRARELDFSASNFQQACNVISRVFAVYTPELIDSINRLLSENTVGKSASLIDTHFEKLGPFLPPNRKMNLSACQPDMRLLLEEIHMHHSKRVKGMDTVNWLSAKVEGMFGLGAVSGEEKILLNLMERAKLIVGLPESFQIFPGGESTSGESDLADDQGHRKPSRTNEGILTAEGREQLLRGEVACSPLDVRFEGDPAKRTVVGTYEIGWLVTLSVWLSSWLNERFETQGRINLRFFADYRNLTFTALFGWLIVKITVTLILSLFRS